MDYFLLFQDQRIPHPVEPSGALKALFENHPDANAVIQLNIKTAEYTEYIDFIAKPWPLVSDRLKQLLQRFEKKATFLPVVLADKVHGEQHLYWGLIPPKLDCLSEDTQFNKDGTIKKLVLDPKPAAACRLFQIDRVMENYLVANLIVVESMLRRNFTGFKLTRIELESKT